MVYPFGFDDNGLPTERFVEKKTASADVVGRSAFIKACLEQTHELEAIFKKLWQRMGLSVNWEYEYSTIAANVRRISQASFLDLLQKGFAYRTTEPALYCTECRTSVAQAELDDAELPATFNDTAFTDAQGNQLSSPPHGLSYCPPVWRLWCTLMMHGIKNLIGTQVTVPLFDSPFR